MMDQKNKKNTLKFYLKVFKGREESYRRSALKQFQDMSFVITYFISLSQADRQVALHPTLAEMNNF